MTKASHTRKKPKRTTITGHRLHAAYSTALPDQMAYVERQLTVIKSVFKKLFSDENFRTLMKAESLVAVPIYFKSLVEDARKHASEDHSTRRRRVAT